MALFCAANRSDLVFLLRFTFLSHVKIFSCEILLVFRLKCPYNCFSFHFCFSIIVIDPGTVSVVSSRYNYDYYNYNYYNYSFGVCSISERWWPFSRVWVTAILLKSPGLFSVFWLFSTRLLFGWSPLVLQLQSPPVLLIILYLLYRNTNHDSYNRHLHVP